MDVIESIMIRGKQGFEKYELITPIEIKIENERVINIINNKKATYRFVTVGLLFRSTIKNDTDQILIVSNRLNYSQDALLNGKMHKILEVINLTRLIIGKRQKEFKTG